MKFLPESEARIAIRTDQLTLTHVASLACELPGFTLAISGGQVTVVRQEPWGMWNIPLDSVQRWRQP